MESWNESQKIWLCIQQHTLIRAKIIFFKCVSSCRSKKYNSFYENSLKYVL